LLDDHQARLAAEEDLVRGNLFGPGATGDVENLEQSRRSLGGGPRHPAERRHRRGLVAEQDGHEAAGDGEADAFGLSGAGELGLTLGVKGNDLGELAFELGDAVVKLALLVEELLEALSFVGASDGAEDLWGVAVEGLSGSATKSGTLGDGAVAVLEDGRGVGDAGVGG
jgi:hypothetical protein